MSVRIAGAWELGWNTPIKEIDLWEYPLRDFGVETLYMTPVTGIQAAVTERPSMEAILAENSDRTIVFVDERGDETLDKFVHPERALYVFGKASQSMMPHRRPSDSSVRIITVENRGMLWPHQAAAILLYDRMLKVK